MLALYLWTLCIFAIHEVAIKFGTRADEDTIMLYSTRSRRSPPVQEETRLLEPCSTLLLRRDPT